MKHVNIEEDSRAFQGLKSPATIIVSGVTGSGKTTLVYKLMKERETLFENPVKKILYCYYVDQPLFHEMGENLDSIEFLNQLPDESRIMEFTKDGEHNLIILDDMIGQVVKSSKTEDLITKLSHHRNCSVLLVSQNLFQAGNCSRTISLNIQYYFLLANFRDVRPIGVLAGQTGLRKKLTDSYTEAVYNKPFGYLLLSLHPRDMNNVSTSPRILSRLHTNIFSGEDLISFL